jgi:membrane associated rhomboid family serine protease
MFPVHNSVPMRYPPVVTWLLIGLNSLVFLYQVSLPPEKLEQFILMFALIPARDFAPLATPAALSPEIYVPFVSNMFLHASWLHLILNMWTLWLFGAAVEDRLGRAKFLVFYLLCGVVASVTHSVFNADSAVPAMGASGAIAGVIGCYIRLFPMAKVVVLVPILFFPIFFEMYAAVFAAIWFFAQFLQGAADFFTPTAGANVAWWAHVGGFLAGVVLSPLLAQPPRKYRPHYADEGVLGFTPKGR